MILTDARVVIDFLGGKRQEIAFMSITKKKTAASATTEPRRRRQPATSNTMTSFRDLRAFGIWAERTDLKDPVQFTSQLRRRMEHGHDTR